MGSHLGRGSGEARCGRGILKSSGESDVTLPSAALPWSLSLFSSLTLSLCHSITPSPDLGTQNQGWDTSRLLAVPRRKGPS